MKAHKLAKILLSLPDVEVKHLWDGESRTTINHVYLSQAGHIVTADNEEYAFDIDDVPENEKMGKHGNWHTPDEEMK